MWTRLIKKSGFDKKDATTNRYKMHIHVLRKYFRTRMSLEIPVDVVEALMGHECYLTEAYRRYSEKQLGEMYNKAVHQISIFEVSSDEKINEFSKQLKEKDREIQELRNDMQRLMIKVLTMEDKQKK